MERWEHRFAFAKDGCVYRELPASPGANSAQPPGLPKPIEQYISELAAAGDGFHFCGSYPTDDGVVIVMKRRMNQ